MQHLSLRFNCAGSEGCVYLSVSAGWAHHGTFRCSPQLPLLVLRMPPPQGRRPLRARRRHPQHGRCRPFSRTPEPRTRAPARMGELLRGSGPWTYRRGGTARPARPPSARRERNDARLRRGHERVAQMRRGVQPRARILLPEDTTTRGYYYHPSRHSAGQPIVAGWAYQFVAQLNFVRESWTAPVDVERVRPAQDANEVA